MKRDLWTELIANSQAMAAAKDKQDDDEYKRLEKEGRELVRHCINLSIDAWEKYRSMKRER